MTHNQVIELAKQVYGTDKWTEAQLERLQRFAELVRADAISDAIIFCADHGVSWITIEAMMEKLKS